MAREQRWSDQAWALADGSLVEARSRHRVIRHGTATGAAWYVRSTPVRVAVRRPDGTVEARRVTDLQWWACVALAVVPVAARAASGLRRGAQPGGAPRRRAPRRAPAGAARFRRRP